MEIKFIKVSVIYFFIGVCFGIYMGVADLFQFASAHAHINLIGWVSLALTGVIYHISPSAGENTLARLHFWFMMIGVPLLTFAMILFGLGQFNIAGPTSGVGGILILIGVIIFVINVLKNIQVKARY